MSAVGTLTITDQNSLDKVQRPVRRVQLSWTSDASGNVSGTLTDYLSGRIERVVFVPGTSGVQPTNLYDLVLLDQGGFDVLAGQGANLSNSAASQVVPGCPLKDGVTTSTLPISIDDKLELQAQNAGSGKQGAVVLYLR